MENDFYKKDTAFYQKDALCYRRSEIEKMLKGLRGTDEYYGVRMSGDDTNKIMLGEKELQAILDVYQEIEKNQGIEVPVENTMSKEELPDTIGDIRDGYVYLGISDQGVIYKNWDNFYNNHQEICYIPEYGVELEYGDKNEYLGWYKLERCDSYTYIDILKLCNGNENMAENVFLSIDWQYPETYIEELDKEEKDSFVDKLEKAEGKICDQKIDTQARSKDIDR